MSHWKKAFDFTLPAFITVVFKTYEQAVMEVGRVKSCFIMILHVLIILGTENSKNVLQFVRVI